MGTKVGTSVGASKSIGPKIEGVHSNIAPVGSENPVGWKSGHKDGAQSLQKAKGRKGDLPKETNSGDL